MGFEAILGQDRALGRLRGLVKSGRLPPALLFHGPSGVGKAMAAVELAKALNCEARRGADACGACQSCVSAGKGLDMDLKVVDAAYQAGVLGEEPSAQGHIRIETVRHLMKDLELRSMSGRWKVAVLEDAERLVPAAANALLKSLEEPPPGTLWVLLAPRPTDLIPTVLSRCHCVPFRPLPAGLVERVLAGLGVPEAEASALAFLSEGSPGRALQLRGRQVPDPASWESNPLAGYRLAESLPRELAQARVLVQDHIHVMGWRLRLKRGPAACADPRVRRALLALESLRKAVKANADPRLALELAALELQDAGGA